MKHHLLNLNPNENHRNQETLKIIKMIHNTSEALKHFAFALAVIAAVIMGAGAGSTQAQIINVNYSGGANATMNGIASYDLIASGSASRPAPSPYSGSTWNDYGNPTASSSGLKDSTGVSTSVGLTTSMQAGPWNDWTGLGARINVSGVLAGYTSYTPIFTLTGLNPVRAYDLFIASQLHNENHPADFKVGVVVKHVANTGTTDWVENLNYAHFTGLIPDSSGTIVVQASCSGAWNGIVVNGFQLVDVGDAPRNAADILSFEFPGQLPTTIDQVNRTISVTVPFSTEVTALSPTYLASPFATGTPDSGTPRNFTTPQTYTVVSGSASVTNIYTVTVSRAPATPDKDILTFGPGATISGTNISWTVPYGTDLTNLTPSYTVSTLATGSPASGSSGNFSTQQTYTVTAEDNSTKVYTVTVFVTPASSAKNILTMDSGAIITGTNIVLQVPYGTDLTTLAPNYTVSTFATGSPVSGTSLDFTTPQTYTITAQNGSTQTYWVSATVLPDAPTAINVNIAGGANPGNAWMNGYYSSDGSARGSASRVAPAAYGGYVWNDFGSGANSTNLKDSRGLLTGVGLTTTMTAGPWNDWTGLGTNRMLVSGLLAGYTSYTNMIALTGLNPAHTYNLYIASLHNTGGQTTSFRAGAVEKSLAYTSVTDWTEGKTHVQFNGLVPTAGGTLTVEGKSTGELVLNGFQLIDTTPQSDITRFTFPSFGAATISGTNISMTVPYGTDVTALAPSYQLSYGATCVPASGSSQNFTSPVHYLVTASDNSTKDYTVTVTIRSIPDPVFTLTAPATWDGRQTITVQSTITNWDLLSANGGTNLNYNWSVAGVAVTKQITPGTLTLTRAQGNGPMTVTLVMDNGGWPVTHAVTINVQQPANDPWVQRTPGATEKPVDGQFFARDDTGYGMIYYNGTQTGTPDTVFLKLYTTQTGTDVQYGATLRQSLAGGAYAFTAPILGGLYKYKVVYGTTTGGTDTPRATVSNLVCGDAYIIQGQSNAEAATPNNGTPPEADYYTSEWIRSYGNSYNGATTGGWGTALRTRTWGTANYGMYQIGAWGIDLARTLLEQHGMPICIMNGAVGGTRIDQHLRNESNHQDTTTIYGRLLTRIEAAKLTHGIRGVLWHQGEQDQGQEGPFAGDYDYKYYQQNFVNLSAAWKQNYPNILNYYIYQIWPAACGSMSNGSDNMLREKQRTLPALYSNMRIMSTLGVVPGSGCHYDLAGYQFMADLMSPLVEQDNYGLSLAEVHTAPDLKNAYFTTAARNEIALEFSQNMAWNVGAPGLIYLDGMSGKVASGSASGPVIKLQLTTASTAKTITYLMGTGSWAQANLLYGTNGIAALTFAEVPLTLTPAVVSFTSWAGTKGLSGAAAAGDADPDHDGIDNALEYVLGGEPNPATVGCNSVALLPTFSQSTGALIFTFRRKDASEGAVNLSFQWSTDLSFPAPNEVPVGTVGATAGGVGVAVAENSPDAATDTIVITVPASKAAGGKLFGRLHATVP